MRNPVTENKIDDRLIPADLAAYYREAQAKLGPGRYQAHMYGREHQERRFLTVVETARMLTRARDAVTCLEIGCCEGMMTRELARLFRYTLAVDFAPSLLQACPSLPGVHYQIVDIETAPADLFYHQEFDVAVMSEVIEHLRDPRAAIQKALGWCDALIVSTPINEQPTAQAFHVEGLGHEQEVGEASGHIWAWDWRGFRELMREFDCWQLWAIDPVTALAVLRGSK